MTTKVIIGIVQEHMPVVVELVGSDGRIYQTQTISKLDSAAYEYVHSGQTLRVREMTTQEMHAKGMT